MSELNVAWLDAEQAGVNFSRVVRPWCHEQWKAGHQIAAHFCHLEEAQALNLLREYWGYVLRSISVQAQVDGMGTDVDGWHLYYKRMFLGYEITKTRLPGKKRIVIARKLRSVSKLSKHPKKMRTYMEQVRAHAATTFGVTFPTLESRK